VRQHPHRFGKRDLFLQFQKLEDIAAGVAPESLEEALFLIDRKRGGLLGMEGTQALELHSRLLQGHVVLDYTHDVRLETQVVDEALRKQHVSTLNSQRSTLNAQHSALKLRLET
jgi:hypothetical protein